MSEVKYLYLDPSRCIGCRSCVAACRECDSHKGESMIFVDYVDRRQSTATAPTLCMHCEDPVAPCAQVCPAQAILISPDGVVHQADVGRCIGAQTCVYACPFGVPKFSEKMQLMRKCNLCYDRTSQGRGPMCATVCPSQAIFYGSYEEFAAARRGRAINDFTFGEQHLRTRNFFVLPPETEVLTIDLDRSTVPATRVKQAARPFETGTAGLPSRSIPGEPWRVRPAATDAAADADEDAPKHDATVGAQRDAPAAAERAAGRKAEPRAGQATVGKTQGNEVHR